MFSIPEIVVSDEGISKFNDGMLFKLPVELGGRAKLDAYSKQRKIGWHKIDHGYWNHVTLLENGSRRIFLGLGLTDLPPKKKLVGEPKFSKAEFEFYLQQIIKRELEYRDETDADFNMLVHDLRRLSTSIYHAAEEARSAHYKNDTNTLRDRLESILATQGMLKLRTDVLDFAGNPSGEHINFSAKVFKKVDKVVRCFKPSAEKRNIVIALNGKSYGKCSGPDAFEIIPYLLIDNAIKYSPPNSCIDVSCNDQGETVKIEITSIGPHISDDEVSKVFEKSYRSLAARKSQKSGTGTGLFLAKNLVAQFGGNIWVETSQTTDDTLNKVRFCMSFPNENTKASRL